MDTDRLRPERKVTQCGRWSEESGRLGSFPTQDICLRNFYFPLLSFLALFMTCRVACWLVEGMNQAIDVFWS